MCWTVSPRNNPVDKSRTRPDYQRISGGLMRRAVLAVFVLAAAPPCAVDAFAQERASIVGVVQDSSGAVLPGVTVEASSPVLIERVRSGVTDGAGRYAIIDLRPGT